ncbi:hypothetical protein DAEQUDRAFT_610579 [Daedalea quercina L-15889]|uniref:Uncharacterized protein n=1 Tax=Daedalea quercina L-15889 TaxID=1314783 RepID=A0A165LH90_9APHY|nr:hypothetical protein DAEQUDRAFT_610579 [Daedalea quercina L-15889]
MSGQRYREFEDTLLSNEIIRALANELKALRARLVAIEDENRDLQAEMRRTTGEKKKLQMLNNVLKARNLEVEGENHSLQQELHGVRQCLQAASLKDVIRGALSMNSVR